jgi:mannose-6-phosphate isomerase
MNNRLLYPLKFAPIYQYRLWGGRRLENLLSEPLPINQPIGEAWLLSDRPDHPSLVAEGPLKGYTMAQLLKQFPLQIMGRLAPCFSRFPLLLKFLDCKEVLSVQVHPSDGQINYIPPGDTGKTEAWVVLETDKDSRIYAGLKPGTNTQNLESAIKNKELADKLHSFIPQKGDGVFIKAGTVHTLAGVVVFEVQENSDVTFRLFDWDRVDPETGKPRNLQVNQALACIDFNQVDIGPIIPVLDKNDTAGKEQLFNCKHFLLWRVKTNKPFNVGLAGGPRILVCIGGKGELIFNGENYKLNKGDVMLLPADVGICSLQPVDTIELLEIGIPEPDIQAHE